MLSRASTRMSESLTWEMVASAAEAMRGVVHRTPVLTSATLDSLSGFRVLLKAEHLQRTGSFKARGAFNAIHRLKEQRAEDEDFKGVVTHSSGNHGQALAWAAKAAGIPCTVVVPSNAPKVKREAIAGYGARIVECEPTMEGREGTAKALEDQGFVLVHAHDDVHVMAGQGVLAKELLEEVGELDAVLVEVGGGGMAGGVATWVAHASPATKVILVSAEGKRLEESLLAGRPLWTGKPRLLDTVADGIRPDRLGGNCFGPVLRHCHPEVLEVSDEKIVAAMKLAWERLKQVVETSTGAGLAGLLEPRLRTILGPGPKTVAVVLCGGNVDLDNLPWLK